MKRCNNAVRYKNGRIKYSNGERKKKDLGTPELIRKRMVAVQGAIEGRQDPAFSATALGILFAHNVICREQMDVGFHFAKLRRQVGFSPPHARIARYEELMDGHISSYSYSCVIDEEADERRSRTYDGLCLALQAAGNKARYEVVRVAVENKLPGWFKRQQGMIIRRSDQRGEDALKQGLNALMGGPYPKAASIPIRPSILS